MTDPDAEQTGTRAQMLEPMHRFADMLRIWWSFDGRQHHTHSWHSREDFIEKILPEQLDLYVLRTAASQDAREALEPYCQHLQICSSRDPLFNNPCDCGLEAALAAPQSAPLFKASQHAERLPHGDTVGGGADTVALAEDPTVDARWNEGCDFAMTQLCSVLGIDPHYVSWDAATETVDGDVCAVIGNIMRARYGEDWDPSATPSPTAVPTGFDAGGKMLEALKVVEPFVANFVGDPPNSNFGSPIDILAQIRAALAAPQPHAGASEPVAWP